MLCYLENTFEMLVGKMCCKWKIVCVYYKEKSLQSRTESLWSVCNLQTILLDCSGFLRKENVPVRVLVLENTSELHKLDSVFKQISKAAPSIKCDCAAAAASRPCLDCSRLVLIL